MNRRGFLALSAAALAAGALSTVGRGGSAATPEAKRLLMPPLLDTRQSGRLFLTAQSGQSDFLGGSASLTAGFNQSYLGPTIIMRNGPLAAEVANTVREPVSVHWHGLLVPGQHDGGPHTPIGPGQSWAAAMQIAQRPTTAWYHSHVHGATARHVYAGLAGVIHHSDGRDDQRGLPSRYGVDDLTLVLQDRRFDDSGAMIYNPDATDLLNGFHGERMLINGQANAVAVVPRGMVRLRLVNGSNARVYTLHFNDRRAMHLVATDGGFLSAPTELDYLRLAPGERAEVLVDFAFGPPPILMSARGLAQKILEFATDDALTPRITSLPNGLDAEPAEPPRGDLKTRRFTLNVGGGSTAQSTMAASGHEGHGAAAGALLGASPDGRLAGTTMSDFGINGHAFEMGRIEFEVALGSQERWIIGGGGGLGVEHPFHVHGVHFRVVRVGGAGPRPEDSGWKDTVVIGGDTEILVRFDHPAGRDAPFMYHCHILEHEDAGMMGQFMVV